MTMTDDEDQAADDMFDDIWTLYFHDPFDVDWTTSSYVRLADVSSSRDLKAIEYVLADKVAHGMFFLMREHVFPCWDDRYNIDGGCVSLKVPKNSVAGVWAGLCGLMVRERMVSSDRSRNEEMSGSSGGSECDESEVCHDASVVNGLSVSPKSYYSIVKVWVSREVADVRRFFRADVFPLEYQGDIIYKANREVISRASQTAQAPKTSARCRVLRAPDTV